MSGPYDLMGTTLDDLERDSLVLLDKAIEYYKPSRVWALYSGGGDSTASTLLASKHPSFSGVLHLDTETGIKDTQEHVISTCSARGWNLTIEPPRTTSYETLVTRMGFPGAPQHRYAYAALKDRALSRLTAIKRAGKTVLLVSGVRTGESVRRMGNAKFIAERLEENRVWCAPILHWPKDACRDYATRHGAHVTPVSRTMGMSGECFCGAYARPGERNLLKMHYPAHEEWISWMEDRVRLTGNWPHWGVQAPKRLTSWENMPTLSEEPLCTDCVRRVA